jgi:hypothetical protein
MLPALAVTLVLTICLAVWARWLARQPRAPRALRHLAWIFPAVWAVGAAGSLWGILHAFGAAQSANPADKATLLARGISFAMNFFAASTALLLLGALVLLALTWRTSWRNDTR